MRTRIALLMALCAAALAGCQESGFDEAKETARPLKVQHLLGESKVPGQAEMPATLSVEALDDTLASKGERIRRVLYIEVPTDALIRRGIAQDRLILVAR